MFESRKHEITKSRKMRRELAGLGSEDRDWLRLSYFRFAVVVLPSRVDNHDFVLSRFELTMKPHHRFVLRSGVGTWVGFILIQCGRLIGSYLGLQMEGDPGFRSDDGLTELARFTLISVWFGAIAAGGASTFFWKLESSETDSMQRAAWTAAFGAIAGAWLGAGVSLLMINLARLDFVQRDSNLAFLLAMFTGVASGVSATIVLWQWRKPE